MKKLPKKVKAQWVKALRSGEYVQGKGYLRKRGRRDAPDEYCCLGVYLEEFDPRPWGNTCGGSLYECGECGAAMPPGSPHEYVFDQLLTGTNICVSEHLATMNDSGKSFAEIADWIEEHL